VEGQWVVAVGSKDTVGWDGWWGCFVGVGRSGIAAQRMTFGGFSRKEEDGTQEG